MRQRQHSRSAWLDRAAVGLSGLCLLHCLALPLLVAGLPFLAGIDASHLHGQLLAIVIPLSVVALAIGYRRHDEVRILFAAALGIALLVIGATIAHRSWGATADRTLTVAGSLLLAAAHYFNSALARRCRITNPD